MCRSVRGLPGLFEQGEALLGGDCLDVSPSHVDGQAERSRNRAIACLLELPLGDLCLARQGREGQQITDELEAELHEAARAEGASNRDRRIGRQAGLDKFCFGNAKVVVGGLQSTVVQERHLNR